MTSTSSTSGVTTGTLATTASRTYVVGTSSGIDTEALIEVAYAAKTARADAYDVEISDNSDKISSYEELRTLSQDVITSLETLTTTYGYGTTDESVYAQMTAYLGASDGADTDNYVSVNVENSAEAGSYTLQVNQLAQAMKVTSDEQSSKTDALGYTGSFSLALGSNAATSFTVTSDMSLSDLATLINNQSSTTNITAKVLKTADAGYTLVLSGTQTAQSMTVSGVSGDDVLQSLGVTDGTNFSNVMQAAQQASITLDGVTVTSSNNTLDGVIDGVSISLLGVTDGATITLDIDHDYSALKDAISGFIDAYNELRDFITTNQEVSTDGTVADDAILFGDSALRSLNAAISSLLSTSSNTGSSFSTLSEIGITFNDDNTLEISDEDTLNAALLNNFSDIQKFFQTQTDISDSNLIILRNTSEVSSYDFTLDVTMNADGSIASARVGGDTSLFTISGTRITGNAGTEYEGLVFAYAGSTDTSIDVTINQGLADLLSTTLDTFSNASSGTISARIESLQDASDRMQDKADRIREQADSYVEKLVDYYAQLETKMSKANLLLKQVEALFGTNNSDN